MHQPRSNSRPRRKRGITWLTVFLVAFAVTSYLVRDWGQPSNSPPGSPPAPSAGDVLSGTGDEAPFLTLLGGERWQSPAGLVYGPGSAEGHRLKHLARHLEDMPDRPVHGVFSGDMNQALRWIDQAYRLYLRGEKQVTVDRQQQRTVIDVDLGESIGYVGGQQGGADGHPPTRRLRLILEDDQVISAYPVWPKRG